MIELGLMLALVFTLVTSTITAVRYRRLKDALRPVVDPTNMLYKWNTPEGEIGSCNPADFDRATGYEVYLTRDQMLALIKESL